MKKLLKIMKNENIKVTVRGRSELIFDGEVYALSSVNEIGPFDILPEHANFVCTIEKSLTIHHTKNKKQEMKIDSGILRVKENIVEVFLGI